MEILGIESLNFTDHSTWIDDQGWCVWLKEDPRSVSAMLRGRGDGREKRYLRFAKHWYRKDPTVTEDFIHRRYAELSQADAISLKNRSRMTGRTKQVNCSNGADGSPGVRAAPSKQFTPIWKWIGENSTRLLCLVLVTHWLAMH